VLDATVLGARVLDTVVVDAAVVGATAVVEVVVGVVVAMATPSPPSELHAAEANSTAAASTRKVVVAVDIMVSHRNAPAAGR